MNNYQTKIVMSIMMMILSHFSFSQGWLGIGSNQMNGLNQGGISNPLYIGVGIASQPNITLTTDNRLQFKDLTYLVTDTVLVLSPVTGEVNWMPLPSAGISSADFNCGIGTLTINTTGGPLSSINKAWLLTGSTTTDTTNYFGTYNNDNIRVGTNNGSCILNRLKEKMIIGTDTNNGSVAIGWDGVSALPTPTSMSSKLLVENGTINPNPYANFPSSSVDAGIYTYANQTASPDGQNVGVAAVADNASIANSIGFAAVISNASVSNTGYYTQIVGNGSGNNNGYQAFVDGNGTAGNVGISLGIGQSSTTTNENMAINASVGGSSTNNTGIGVVASGAGAFNNGISASATGSLTYNLGIYGYASGAASNGNIGMDGEATGSSNANIGSTGVAYGDNVQNNGIQGVCYGANALNIGVTGSVRVPIGGSDASSTCIGVYGYIDTFSAGINNYGIEGDLSKLIPISGVPYYAVYGIAANGGAGGGVNPPTNGYSPLDPSYAGYFEGDVFCSNTYYYSDPKLKENIQDYAGALDQLKKLPVKSYNFKMQEYPNMNLPKGNQIGVLSTDMKLVFPNLVKPAIHPAGKKDKENIAFDAVNYNALIPVLLQAVKELDAKTDSLTTNNTLTNTVAAQQAQIAAQTQQIAELRSMIEDLCNNGCAGFNPKGNSQSTQSAALYQSIPNPTSGAAGIGYMIGFAFSNALIQVSDKTGSIIGQYTIAAQGTGSVTFDSSSVAAGTYNYSLIIDGKVYATKTMVIVKD
jgi:hypothetical protein